MKKFFLVFCLIGIFLLTSCFAGEKINITNFTKNYAGTTSSINILGKKYLCYYHNCYDFSSSRYNKFTKLYIVDTIMDLMWCNAHQEYKSPYGDGYISHLIFETRLHNNELSVKCKGFVVGDVVVDYKNGKASSAHYNIITTHRGKPSVIKNIGEFEDISIDKEEHIKIIKSLVNNQ